MTRYRIRSLGLLSAVEFGLALGVLASLLPACLLGLASVSAVAALRNSMEAAAQTRVVMLGQTFTLNLVQILNLEPTMESVRLLEGLGGTLGLTVAMFALAVAAVLCGVSALLLALAYNALAALSGGLAIRLEAEPLANQPPEALQPVQA